MKNVLMALQIMLMGIRFNNTLVVWRFKLLELFLDDRLAVVQPSVSLVVVYLIINTANLSRAKRERERESVIKTNLMIDFFFFSLCCLFCVLKFATKHGRRALLSLSQKKIKAYKVIIAKLTIKRKQFWFDVVVDVFIHQRYFRFFFSGQHSEELFLLAGFSACVVFFARTRFAINQAGHSRVTRWFC